MRIKKIAWTLGVIFLISPAFAQEEVVGDIVIRGLSNISETVVRNVIRTKEGQVFQQSQLARDRQALESLGVFQDVKVYGVFLNETRTWRVIVEVVEWPIVREVRISGNTLIPEEKIRSALKIKIGEIFKPIYLEEDAYAITKLYRDSGYIGRVVKYEPDESNPSVFVIEIVETRVREIEFQGLTRTKPSVIRNLMDTKEGDFFDQSKYDEDVLRIWETRWFDDLQPDTREPSLGQIDLIFNFKEARTGLFNVGASVDPKNRVIGFISYSDSNFKGTGKSVGVNLSQSTQGLGTGATLTYSDKFIDNKRSALDISLYSRPTFVFGASLLGGGDGELEKNQFSQRKTGGSITFSRPLQRRLRGFIGIKAENTETINFESEPGEEFLNQEGTVAALSMGFIRNRRDNPTDPALGDWAKLLIEPSFSNITSVGGSTTGDPIIGENFFTKVSLDYRMYFSKGAKRTSRQLTEPRKVLAVRFYGGIVFGDTPFFEQFFAGGAYGVRGYPEDRFWGKKMLMTQIEYRYPVQQTISVIPFVDYGGAWDGYPGVNDFTQSKDIDLHLGYGVGVAVKTPLGPIRLDLGFDTKGKGRVYFQFGTVF